MYLVVEGQSCPAVIDRLGHAEIFIGQEYEYVKDEFVVKVIEAAGPCTWNKCRLRGRGNV